MVIRVSALLALFFYCSLSYAEKAVEIPLNEVWANMSSRYMLAAKQLAKLEPEYFGRRENRRGPFTDSMTNQIQKALSAEFPPKSIMKPGLVVMGKGREALEYTYAVLVKGQPTQDKFPKGSEISAVFFTRVIGYMHLMQIQRVGNTITISYCLEPTASNAIVSAKIAIIPLGKLPPGEYRVNIRGFSKEPDDRNSDCESIPDDRMKKLICQPFEFSIAGNGTNETTHSDK